MNEQPVILITGAAGDIGSALASTLASTLASDYRVVGLDRSAQASQVRLFEADLTSERSVQHALAAVRREVGARIASVVHLAAYFDFTGEDSPLYRKVNVDGTRHLLRGLQGFEVEQFVYVSTMLVHGPVKPGERIDEGSPLAPRWAYPKSKAAAEAVVEAEHGSIPYVTLRLAGLYDARSSVPTLAQQIARIYERDVKAHLYSGDVRAGQAMLHREDMHAAFRRVIERRGRIASGTAILVGESEAPGYDELQDAIGKLIHGEEEWTTLRLPKAAAKMGAWLEEKLEPVVPDSIDQGEKPFVRPFMISMSDDHYALDITRARDVLGWQPQHRLRDELPAMIRVLRNDPAGWYQANGITPPPWLETAAREDRSPEDVRARHEERYRSAHRRHVWSHFLNIALGSWLLTSPPLLDLRSPLLAASDMISGALLIACAAIALSWRLAWSRWACAAIGLWVASAPILFWAPTAVGYLNDTLVGGLIMALAVALPPEPGVSPVAATTGPATPPGWSYNPSSWTQRLPIIALAFVGLYVSRHLASYQLGYVEDAWEPFFAGGPDPKNGTEEIITSSISEAWPVSDAAVGAYTYLLEIVTGAVGSVRRWRTMPWLVMLFGLMIAPLGVVSIFFIIIQPIWIGTWCTLCLIAAVAMLIQIPYSLDELVATGQFLARRRRAGESLLRVFLRGDTDQGGEQHPPAEFDRAPGEVVREILTGGVSLPWTLGVSALIGVSLMFTRLTLDAEGATANADHFIGALVVTVCAIAAAEVARPARFLNIGAGAALLVTPLFLDASTVHTIVSVASGVALLLLSLPSGRIAQRYGAWQKP